MSGLPQAWKAMFKEKERLAATVLTYLGRDECGRRESGSHGLADRNAFRSSGDHFGPGQKCFPLKRRPLLSAQAATISDPKSILSGTPGRHINDRSL
jgi:hypothetical protein